MSEETRQAAFELFAKVYPHEASKIEPERFWAYFQRERPGVTREQMTELLEATR